MAQTFASLDAPAAFASQNKVRYETHPLIVRICPDFTITGDGSDEQWKRAQWNDLTKLDTGGQKYTSRFKILYSPTGIYLLFNGDDEKIATKFDENLGDIYNGDAFEAFFHPEPQKKVYFEYEINQLNKELILLLSRSGRKSHSWAPWHYEDQKSTKKAVIVIGGKPTPGEMITSWSAEIFFPNELFDLLPNVPPKSGAIWNANFYRLDYDTGKMIKWSWSPTIKRSFHELEHFQQIQFE